MACSISISSSNVPASKHLDGKKHVGLRSSATNVKFVINAGHAIKTPCSRFFLVIRASNEQETSKRSGLSIGDCGSAVVAGIIPEALPVPPKPAAPVGTPLVSSPPLNRRPRCNQKSTALRSAFQETNLLQILFIHFSFMKSAGEEDTPIGALPGCYGLGWRHGLVEEVIHTDVTLDPYSSDGHDSIIREDGVIMNDETVHQLCKQAVSQAQAGVDVVPVA